MNSKSLVTVVILGALIVGRMTMVYAGQDWIGFAVTLAIAFGFMAGLMEVARRTKLLTSLSAESQALSQALISGETTEPPTTGLVGDYIRARLMGSNGHLPQLVLTLFRKRRPGSVICPHCVHCLPLYQWVPNLLLPLHA